VIVSIALVLLVLNFFEKRDESSLKGDGAAVPALLI
jgi:hypothetical protein